MREHAATHGRARTTAGDPKFGEGLCGARPLAGRVNGQEIRNRPWAGRWSGDGPAGVGAVDRPAPCAAQRKPGRGPGEGPVEGEAEN